MWSNPQFPAEILDGKLHFLSSDFCKIGSLVLNETTFIRPYTTKKKISSNIHCVKSVQIQSFFWSVFSHIRTEYGEILQSKCGKIQTRKNSIFGHFSRSNCLTEEHSEHTQTSEIDLFVKKSYQLNTVDWLFLQKISILNVWLNSAYTSPFHFAMLKIFRRICNFFRLFKAVRLLNVTMEKIWTYHSGQNILRIFFYHWLQCCLNCF